MAIEVVIFQIRPTVARADFLQAVEETTTLLKTQEGFLSRTVSQAESGEWLDILYWESIDAAKAAITVFQTDQAGKRFSDYLDGEHFQVFYTDVVSESTERA
ncbi:antibiotic biosynthesis monooxygenase family protein [Ktedonospora formicarum]|nr:antibiotic biosynthesis monooxygenase [Ktedonospora formicarum]